MNIFYDIFAQLYQKLHMYVVECRAAINFWLTLTHVHDASSGQHLSQVLQFI